jgi:hypothetical protein
MRSVPVTAAALALLAGPGVAFACGVCGAADDNANTFLLSTIFLSLLPLAMIFGGAYALYYASQHPELFDA